MNLNNFIKSIAQEEGKKEQISIAQIKEVFNIIGRRIRKMTADELIDFLNALRRLKPKK